MLINLRPDRKKEKAWKRWNKTLDKMYPSDKKHSVLGYKRFKPYVPTGKEFTKDHLDNFTGVFVMEDGYGCCYPFEDITNCTRSYSNGNNRIFGLCDNASQVIDLYNAVFNSCDCNIDNEIIKRIKRWKVLDNDRFLDYPSSKYAKCAAEFWKGNHVIILHRMGDFRWHKWGPYIGDFNHRCEYFSDEEGIEQIYEFDIFKVV